MSRHGTLMTTGFAVLVSACGGSATGPPVPSAPVPAPPSAADSPVVVRATISDSGCEGELAVERITAGRIALEFTNGTTAEAAFDWFHLSSADWRFEDLETRIGEERARAESGNPDVLGPGEVGDRITSGLLEPGAATTVEGRAAGPGTYAIVCLRHTDAVDDIRPFALIGPIEIECQPSERTCIGPLAAGLHSTANLLIPVTFQVPDGWTKELDVAGSFQLVSPAMPSGHIGIRPDWAIAIQTECTPDPEPGLGRTVDDLVAWLTEHPGLVATDPQPVEIGGLEGQVLDVSKDSEWSGPCEGRVWLFTHVGTIDDPGWWDAADGRRLRFYVLDAGDGHTATIHVETDDEASFEAFVDAATPIVESFDFGQATTPP